MLIRIFLFLLLFASSALAGGNDECVVGSDCYVRYVSITASAASRYTSTLTLTDFTLYPNTDTDSAEQTALTEQTGSCASMTNEVCLNSTGNGIYIFKVKASVFASMAGKELCIDVRDINGTRKVEDSLLCKYVMAESITAGYPTVKLSSGTGTGQISLSSGSVTVGTINTNVITAGSIQDGAITPAKEYVIAGTVNAASTTLRVYTALGATGERKYNNMCLYSASNGERSRIMSTGNGYFNVRGFSTAPTDTTVLRIYADGCL